MGSLCRNLPGSNMGARGSLFLDIFEYFIMIIYLLFCSIINNLLQIDKYNGHMKMIFTKRLHGFTALAR